MNFKVELAKNGDNTLSLNNIYLYSKYSPRKDANKFIHKEYDKNAKGYFLVGLGLGYHLEALIQLDLKKPIIVLALDKQELKIFLLNSQIEMSNNVEIILGLEEDIDLNQFQIIIPLPWMKAIGQEHKLNEVLEDIKIRQMSYETYSGLLQNNFVENINNSDPSISKYKGLYEGKWACLVSAGPSLDTTIELLKTVKDKCYILSVGSALNTLLKNDIVPDAVIITDAQKKVARQLKNDYQGMLFYLATANHEMTQVHEGERVIIFQEGFSLAELVAEKRNEPLIETGGSVATTAFSLLEYMGFQDVVLFGQDLGFKGETTHSVYSTSGKKVAKDMLFRKVMANNGKYIRSTANLSTYHRWFEKKIRKSNVNFYNTAWEGAKIQGIPCINTKELIEMLMK